MDLSSINPFSHPLPTWGRRDFLKVVGLGGLCWLTPVGEMLARAAEKDGDAEQGKSIILLWLGGGPSQLETFDPHPGKNIAAGTKAIKTAAKDIQLAEGFPQLADRAESLSIVRSVVSKEGDHERGTYTMKTGYRPDPTVIHPSIGAICCAELPSGKTEIPRHIAILPGAWPCRGGFLGDEYDAFKTGDPLNKVPDVTARVSKERDTNRFKDLEVVERAFAKGRQSRVDSTLHRMATANARTMMTSDQLKAFDVALESEKLRQAYGDNPFGRGCLAARRLIQVGVRCVEVGLDGWDSHVENHNIHRNLLAILDPAFSTLLKDLKDHKLLDRTVVICMGEFGRTPMMNRLGGRDHWPTGFSVALAGGGIKGGRIIGETDSEGSDKPKDPVEVADVHATVLKAVGIDITKVNQSKIGRTIKVSEGQPIDKLLS